MCADMCVRVCLLVHMCACPRFAPEFLCVHPQKESGLGGVLCASLSCYGRNPPLSAVRDPARPS